jgi:hypothetical protein
VEEKSGSEGEMRREGWEREKGGGGRGGKNEGGVSVGIEHYL